jgi:hypothetical protein
MAYKLLGMGVWKAAKWYLRRRIDTRKLLLAGGVVALGAGAVAFALSSRDE